MPGNNSKNTAWKVNVFFSPPDSTFLVRNISGLKFLRRCFIYIVMWNNLFRSHQMAWPHTKQYRDEKKEKHFLTKMVLAISISLSLSLSLSLSHTHSLSLSLSCWKQWLLFYELFRKIVTKLYENWTEIRIEVNPVSSLMLWNNFLHGIWWMRWIYIKISNSVYLDDYFLCQFLVLLLLKFYGQLV